MYIMEDVNVKKYICVLISQTIFIVKLLWHIYILFSIILPYVLHHFLGTSAFG